GHGLVAAGLPPRVVGAAGAHLGAGAEVLAFSSEPVAVLAGHGALLPQRHVGLVHVLLVVGDVVGIVGDHHRQIVALGELVQARQRALLGGLAVVGELDVHVLAADRGDQRLEVGLRAGLLGGIGLGILTGDARQGSRHRSSDAAGQHDQALAVAGQQLVVDQRVGAGLGLLGDIGHL